MKSLEQHGSVSDISVDSELNSAVLERVPDLSDDSKFSFEVNFSQFDEKAREVWEEVKGDSRAQRYIQALDEFYSFVDQPSTEDMPAPAKKLADNEYMKSSDARDRHARAAISALLIHKKRELSSAKSPEQAKADAAELVEQVKSQPIVINYQPGSVSAILDSGRVKNQFETGYGTWEDLDGRSFSEALTSGVSPTTPSSQRPIYGTVAVDGVNTFTRYTLPYGGVRLVLKDSVKDRSTVTAGDSFERRHVGSPARNPDPTMFPKADQENGYQFYVEAQVLGGLPIEDIEELILTDDGANLPSRNQEFVELMEKADSLGVKTRFLTLAEDYSTRELTREEYVARLAAFSEDEGTA